MNNQNNNNEYMWNANNSANSSQSRVSGQSMSAQQPNRSGAQRVNQYTSARNVNRNQMTGVGSSSGINSAQRRPDDRSEIQYRPTRPNTPEQTVRVGNNLRPENNGTTQNEDRARRQLTSDERRRMEAARLAAMNSVSRMSEDEEYRLRRMEQQYLEIEQPIPKRATDNRTRNQNHDEHKLSGYRRNKKVKINVGAVLFVLIIAAVIGLSAWQISKNPNIPDIESNKETNNNAVDDDEGVGAFDSVENESESENSDTEVIEEDIKLLLCDSLIYLNKYFDKGYQILVNNDYRFADVDEVELTNVYSSRTGKLKVSGTGVGMEERSLRALEAMLVGLENDTGCDDLLLSSGYRNIAEQEAIYSDNLKESGEEYTKMYVANPGFSEHHTGLACDLTFFTDDGATIPIAEHEFGSWLWDNCSDYGFILRYPKDKIDITHIAYEAWHFRYIGFPHAKATEYFGMCYEEYVEKLKDYTIDTKMLYVSDDGVISDSDIEALPTNGGFLVYYIPMTDGESTEIKIPRGDAYADYEISGNNKDGFIITINLS